jgi:hypothetical protein
MMPGPGFDGLPRLRSVCTWRDLAARLLHDPAGEQGRIAERSQRNITV